MSKVSVRKINTKHSRILEGGVPRVVDLFAGCGGISLGFRLAGCEIMAGFDKDDAAMETWWFNLSLDRRRGSKDRGIDLVELSPKETFAACGLKERINQVDILVGGPPCQAYSKVGRSKLKSVTQDEDAHLNDDRGTLWECFLDYVEELAPLAVLMENVPDSLNYGGLNIPVQICQRLQELGYASYYSLLNAAEYGVPQSRERVFVVAVHSKLYDGGCLFPTPTHQLLDDMDVLAGGRSRIRNIVKGGKERDAVIPPLPDGQALGAVTVEQALEDLPVIEALDKNGKPLPLPQGSPDAQIRPYVYDCENGYQHLMRLWPGLEMLEGEEVSGNIVRDTPRDFPIFRRMKGGEDFRDASRIADERFEQARQEYQAMMAGLEVSAEALKKLKKDIVPPYDRNKFFSKWLKMRGDRPSHTLVAHLKNDTYSHIHYDSRQARGISVREAARLQSFPDGFRFFGALGDAYAQIGNAVPPWLIFHMASSLMEAIGSKPASIEVEKFVI